MPDTANQLAQGVRGGSEGAPAIRAVLQSADAPVEPTARPKRDKGAKTGKKKPIKPILLVVLLLAVGMVAKGKIVKPHYGPGHPAPNGQIIELQSAGGNASITTNMSDGHLAQLGISLQMTTVASAKTEAKDADALMGLTVQELGAENYNALLAPSGRAQLAASLLGGYQRILGKTDGGEQVSAVYFTSFVLQ